MTIVNDVSSGCSVIFNSYLFSSKSGSNYYTSKFKGNL